MSYYRIQLICRHTCLNLLKEPTTKWLVGLFFIILLFALSSSYISQLDHYHTVTHHSQEVRDNWESNPDKHPHRMAHYGYVVFRDHFPMSFFDAGMNSFLGNAVFLEAHRQNSINFSKVSLSNSLMRFGELSAGPIIQLLLPLLIFFWGFSSIAGDRESGVLRMIRTQGASWTEVILGRAAGIYLLSLAIFLPIVLLALFMLILYPSQGFHPDTLLGFGLTVWSYLIYLAITTLIAVWISAISQTKRSALIQLIGCWLIFTIVFPKIAQVSGQILIPTPSKIEFEAAIEEDIIKQGDSHNPNDPLFNSLRDSVLSKYGVSTTNELPFNYSGFIMSQGEQLSTMTYREHKERLIELYQQQNRIVNWTAFFNPYIAIKHISMSLAGTDFKSFRHFDNQAEDYRYTLAQDMNDLQMKYISNTVSSSADKAAMISRDHWINYPKFEQQHLSFCDRISNARLSLVALLVWVSGLMILVVYRSKSLSAL